MEVCTDEAAPEVTSNKSMLARLVGLSGNETRSSQRWRDLIQAAKKSKIIGNKDAESNRFGSIKRNRNENNAGEQPQTDISYVELQKSDIKEVEYQGSGSNLYPKIPEEDLMNSGRHNQVSAVTMQPVFKPKAVMQINGSPQTKQELHSSMMAGLKLSPENLMKHPKQKPQEIKYQAPKPTEKMSSNSISPNGKNVLSSSPLHLIAKPTKVLDASSNEISENTDNAFKNSHETENAVCKNTTITVTSSPEKLGKSRAEPTTSIEIIKDQPNTSQLIDFKETDEKQKSTNATAVRIDNFDHDEKSVPLIQNKRD
ncbi:transient receptor potential-gamma protein [Caerostris extrusa]|uniref:Transient receptor potential-gamma protein n=1 Tax=Caerostris extrusa TaxID=172846 RepID=A0AAV4YC93_CAEEX|nr:transient receptor potential-gamma protein [Caerostris extrusa]